MCRVIIRPQARVLGGLVPAEAPANVSDLLADMNAGDFAPAKSEPLDESSGLLNGSEEFALQETGARARAVGWSRSRQPAWVSTRSRLPCDPHPPADADLLAMFHELSDDASPESGAPMGSLPVPALPSLVPFEAPVAPAPVVPGAQPMNLFEQQMMFQQAMLAQQVQQQQQMGLVQMVAKPACYPGMRRGKSPEEIAAQIERTKQRRRESAHRSRSRRKDYMKHLEDENEVLKAECAALRAQLKSQGIVPVSISSQAGSGLSGIEQHDSGSSTDMMRESACA